VIAEHGRRGDMVGDAGRHRLGEAESGLIRHRDGVYEGRTLYLPMVHTASGADLLDPQPRGNLVHEHKL
jgi:hypothetical protein